jgi:hypothetical protein
MKLFSPAFPALFFAISLNFAAAGFAAGTNSPADNNNAAETGPLAPLTASVLHQTGVFLFDTKMGVALGLISPDQLNRVVMVPEEEPESGVWIEAVRVKGVMHLVLGRTEISATKGSSLTVYLTSSSGVLEKAARRVNGGEFNVLSLHDAERGFQKQVAYWQAWLAKSGQQ